MSGPHSPEDIKAPPSSGPCSPQFYDAPEVVPGTAPEYIANPDYGGEKMLAAPNTDPSSSPQAVYDNGPGSLPQTVSSISSPPYNSIDTDPKSGPQALNLTGYADEAEKYAGLVSTSASMKRRPWWKKKRILVIIAVVTFIIIGLVVGLIVELTMRNNNKSSNDGNPGDDTGDDTSGGEPHTNGTTISCDGGLCPSIISATVHDGQLNVFARTSSNRLAVRTHDGDRWASGWIDLGTTPGGGSIISQPVSVAWEVEDGTPRIDVFVVSSRENRVFGKHRVNSDGTWSDWVDLGPGAGSSVQVCMAQPDRIYLWTTDEESCNITQNFWVPNPNAASRKTRRQLSDDEGGEDDDEDEDGEDGSSVGFDSSPGNWLSTETIWDTASSPGQGPSSSSPGIACRDSTILHDLIWYDRNAERAWHQSYDNSASSWGTRRSFDGDWVGDPSIFSYPSSGSQRFDFFGVQSNSELYTLSWSSSDGFSSLTSLGGSIASSPISIQFPSSSSTRDVLALGSDGKLQHQHYDGTSWSREWENLNITARSAPSAVVFEDAAWLFWLSEEGSLIAGRVTASNGGSEWAGELTTEGLGGDLTLEYFIAES